MESQVHDESTDETFKSPNINLPFCTLKSISNQLSTGSCKLAGEVNNEEIAKSTTLSILEKLSDYSWDAKAVLTLAAFALDYGEFNKTPQVVELIYKLEKLSFDHNLKEIPDLALAMKNIPVAVYWAIRSTLAWVTNITICVTKDKEDKPSGDLDSTQKMINRTPFRINEVFRALIFGKIVDQAIKTEAQTTVNVDDLKGKTVLWFISNVDVSDDYINAVTPNDKIIKKEVLEQYRIVWIPIVEGIRFINIEWQFKGKPTVVVTNPDGDPEYKNNEIPDQISIWNDIIKLEDHIPSYLEWFHFEEKARTFMKEPKTEIKLVNHSSSKLQAQFWSRIESLLLSKIKNVNSQQADQYAITREVQKLLWFKDESGWAMLFKGFNVVASGHGSTMLKVLEGFQNWKDIVGKTNFETAFQEYHNQAVEDSHRCQYFDIKDGAKKDIPYDAVHCPDCSRVMVAYLRFRCCHKDDE
ncbi:hypothetical protein FEM48_Zijuj07G0113500 [Ziziphus jujuba var. spinosa]|uniref:Protein SIEVE ELEMENT OCCLUSION B-like n=1 Tax=Ziziphus jujuba var. spinosa TaxID=714518 RepID=A0A978V4C1_ZIZJJ|nr:hypothetical protein FEM48_Zijuj07G0113500 [Ziziphus jujuba var. spinosa]